MKLDAARLCLDCEELHEQQECPSCGSEAFAFLTRWVPSSVDRPAATRRQVERRAPETEFEPRTAEQIEAYRQLLEGKPPRGRGRLITGSVIGAAAALGLAGWAWRSSGRRGQRPEARGQQETGDQRPETG